MAKFSFIRCISGHISKMHGICTNKKTFEKKKEKYKQLCRGNGLNFKETNRQVPGIFQVL